MSLRIIFGLIFVVAFSIYAWRNYFPSLCALLVFTAFFKHPDMPRSIAGIPGLEFWNLLALNVTAAWWVQRRNEDAHWDMERPVKVAFVLYCGVIFTAFLRMFLDPGPYFSGQSTQIILDFLIAPLKFLLPGLILYDSARTRDRAAMAMAAIMLGYFLLSLQVVRYMGLHVYSGDELNKRGAKILQHAVGYDRVDVAMMLAGSVWAMIALSRIARNKWQSMACWGAAGFILLAETLTGGRSGYIACGLVGLLMCLIRWRKFLPLIPLAALILVVFLPGIRERMLHGFDKQSGNVTVDQDSSEITSGRTTIWPYVIKKIEQSPLIGYGRYAMMRTGLSDWLESELGEVFGHPHNAYLEMLFDNGIIGFFCIIPVYFLSLKKSLSLFRDRDDALYEAAGGIAVALLLALFITGLGAQTLYPREDVIWMWGAVAVALRVWTQRENVEVAEFVLEEDEAQFRPGVFSGAHSI